MLHLDQEGKILMHLQSLKFRLYSDWSIWTSANYYTGPNKDTYDATKPDYFEFGLTIKEVEVYIKISLGLENKMVDCRSFHKAERSITYPLK